MEKRTSRDAAKSRTDDSSGGKASRLLSLTLALVLSFGMLPVGVIPALADPGDPPQPAPDVELRYLGGEPITLSPYSGSVVGAGYTNAKAWYAEIAEGTASIEVKVAYTAYIDPAMSYAQDFIPADSWATIPLDDYPFGGGIFTDVVDSGSYRVMRCETTSYTFHDLVLICLVAEPLTDDEAIAAATAAVESAFAAAATRQADAPDEAAALARIDAIIAALDLKGAEAGVDKIDYTPAVAGTEGDPPGTNGAYVFSATLAKGDGSPQATTALTLVITATPYRQPGAVWDGISTSEPACDDAGVYLISSADELAWFADTVNSGQPTISARLVADIYLNEPDAPLGAGSNIWAPISATAPNAFAGSFDGASHTIRGLNIISGDYQGLFGYIAAAGSVSDLIIADSAVSGTDYLGLAAGSNAGVISGVIASGSSIAGRAGVGGLAGSNAASGTITASANAGATVTQASNQADNYIGGLAGTNAGAISFCYNTADIINAATSGYGYYGGITGQNTGSIEHCYNTGDIPQQAYFYAGIAAANSGAIANCYNVGIMHTAGNGRGGIYSSGSGAISNSYSIDSGTTTAARDGIRKTTEEIKALWPELGGAFEPDLTPNINGGYPILKWQNPDSVYTLTLTVLPADSAVALLDGASQPVAPSSVAEGVFTFSGLTPGAYSYTVENDDADCIAQSAALSIGSLDVYRTVTLAVRTYSAVFQLTPPDALVALADNTGAAVAGIADTAAGTVSFELPMGSYAYSASAFGYIGATGSILVEKGTGAAGSPYTLTLAPSSTHRLSFSVAPFEAAAAATITVSHATAGQLAAETDGSFLLPDGDYRYTVASPGFKTVRGSLSIAGDGVTIAIAMETRIVWDGSSVLEPSTDGAGVYLIATADELAWFADAVNAGQPAISTRLAADIFLNDPDEDFGFDSNVWTPIGASLSTAFAGSFDGGGFTISGLYTNGGSYVGLFGYIAAAGRVESLSMADSNVSGSSYAGLVAGSNAGTVSGVTVADSAVSSIGNGGIVGGIAGSNSGSITACANVSATVTGTQVSVDYGFGGIAGQNSGTILLSYNQADLINAGSSGYGYYGGITGSNQAGGTVTSGYNTASIPTAYVSGGIAGSNEATVASCYNVGTVSSSASFRGGIIGNAGGGSSASNCYYLAGSVSGGNNLGTSQTAEQIMTLAAQLGAAFRADLIPNINLGYPILRWQDPDASYTLTLTVTPADSVITLTDGAGAEIAATTTTGGIYAYSGLKAGAYGYTAENAAADCIAQTGSLVITTSDASRSITLAYNTYATVFTLTPPDALVALKDSQGATQAGTADTAAGTVSYDLPAGDYHYTVSAFGYSDAGGDMHVDKGTGAVGSPLAVVLTASGIYSLSFDISPAEAAAVATVTLTHASEGLMTAEADGSYLLPDGAYSYTVACLGYKTVSGRAEIAGDDLTVTIALQVMVVWDGSSLVEPSTDGEGVYLIATAAELAWFAEAVNSGQPAISARLTADIFLNDPDVALGAGSNVWTPIGSTLVNRYMGDFDGAGHTISGIYIDDVYAERLGFCGYLGTDGVVHDLAITDSSLTGLNYLGLAAGYSYGTVFGVTVDSSAVTGSTDIGGIVGYSADGSSISSCANRGAAVTQGSFSGGAVGGIVGNNWGTVRLCVNNAELQLGYTVPIFYTPIGGIVGRNYNIIDSCYNTGSLAVAGQVGGIVGSSGVSNCTISNCYNVGPVLGGHSGFGGITGYNTNAAGLFSNCYYLDSSVTGATVNIGEAKNDAEMQALAPFLGGDFVAGPAGGYPLLAWEAGLFGGPSELPVLLPFAAEVVDYALGDNSGALEIAAFSPDGGELSYQWYKALARNWYGQPIIGATQAEYLPATDAADRAFYYVAVTNTAPGKTPQSLLSGLVLVTVGDPTDSDIPVYSSGAWQIASAAQLAWFRDMVNSDAAYRNDNARLTADIDLFGVCSPVIGSWVPIGDLSYPYGGDFNGAGHSIENLYINYTTSVSGSGAAGLFAASSGSIRNLSIASGSVSGNARLIGALAGQASGQIVNCFNAADVTNNDTIADFTGGLVGITNDSCTFSGCANAGDVSSSASSAGSTGGIVGSAGYYGGGSQVIIIDCYNSGRISSVGTTVLAGDSGTTGGIVGTVRTASLTMRNCYSSGGISAALAGRAGALIGGSETYSSYSTSYIYLSLAILGNNHYLETAGLNAGLPAANNYTLSAAQAEPQGMADLKALAPVLGAAFTADEADINNGYPILAWQATGEVSELLFSASPALSGNFGDFFYTLNSPAVTPLYVNATASDGGQLAYQWYRSTSGDRTDGEAIPGAAGLGYTPPVDAPGSAYYYVVVTNSAPGRLPVAVTSNLSRVFVSAAADFSAFTLLVNEGAAARLSLTHTSYDATGAAVSNVEYSYSDVNVVRRIDQPMLLNSLSIALAASGGYDADNYAFAGWQVGDDFIPASAYAGAVNSLDGAIRLPLATAGYNAWIYAAPGGTRYLVVANSDAAILSPTSAANEITADIRVEAVFEPLVPPAETFNLGIDCDPLQGTASATWLHDNTWLVQARPAPGYAFNQWLVDYALSGNTEASRTVMLNADTEYEALFLPVWSFSFSSNLPAVATGSFRLQGYESGTSSNSGYSSSFTSILPLSYQGARPDYLNVLNASLGSYDSVNYDFLGLAINGQFVPKAAIDASTAVSGSSRYLQVALAEGCGAYIWATVVNGAYGVYIHNVEGAGFGVNVSRATPTTITSDIRVEAVFAPKAAAGPYTATALSADETMGGASATPLGGNLWLLTATPAPGYLFTGWDDGFGFAEHTVLLTADEAFTAGYKPDDSPTVFSPLISVDPATSVLSVQVTPLGRNRYVLLAEAESDYVFSYWEQGGAAVSTQASYTTPALVADTAYVAHFEPAGVVLAGEGLGTLHGADTMLFFMLPNQSSMGMISGGEQPPEREDCIYYKEYGGRYIHTDHWYYNPSPYRVPNESLKPYENAMLWFDVYLSTSITKPSTVRIYAGEGTDGLLLGSAVIEVMSYGNEGNGTINVYADYLPYLELVTVELTVEGQAPVTRTYPLRLPMQGEAIAEQIAAAVPIQAAYEAQNAKGFNRHSSEQLMLDSVYMEAWRQLSAATTPAEIQAVQDKYVVWLTDAGNGVYHRGKQIGVLFGNLDNPGAFGLVVVTVPDEVCVRTAMSAALEQRFPGQWYMFGTGDINWFNWAGLDGYPTNDLEFLYLNGYGDFVLGPQRDNLTYTLSGTGFANGITAQMIWDGALIQWAAPCFYGPEQPGRTLNWDVALLRAGYSDDYLLTVPEFLAAVGLPYGATGPEITALKVRFLDYYYPDMAEAVKDVIRQIAAIDLGAEGAAERLTAARLAYDALTGPEQAQVFNYNDLRAAELAGDPDGLAALAVDILIEAIGTVGYSESSLSAIEAARAAYDAAAPAVQALVSGLGTLEAAEVELASLAAAAVALAETAITALPEAAAVMLADEDDIMTARAAYGLLLAAEREGFAPALLARLVAAETALAEIKNSAAMAGLDEAREAVLDYLLATVDPPGVGSTSGEWAVLALARAGRIDLDDPWALAYQWNLVAALAEGAEETGSKTDAERIILALSSLGIDASDYYGAGLLGRVAGYSDTEPINYKIFGLIALDSRPYPGSREAYIAGILDAQLDNGGWALAGIAADPDTTAMAVQALAPYSAGNPAVAAAIDDALACLSAMQSAYGGFGSVESDTQVVVALCALGIDVATDARFQKDYGNPLTSLLSYRDADTGAFIYLGVVDQMATEQAAYGLVAYDRFVKGMSPLYNMSDAFVADPEADDAAIAAAVSIVEGATYSAAQSAADNEAAAKAVTEAVVATLSLGGVSASVQGVGFTAAVAGTAGEPSGTDGSYIFTVVLSRGAGTPQTTVELSLSISATPYDPAADDADITAAKAAVDGAFQSVALIQAAAADAAAAQAAVEDAIASLGLGGVAAEVATVSFTAAIAGDEDTPAGTDGSYSFDVTLTKGGGTPQTATITVTVSATPYQAPGGQTITVSFRLIGDTVHTAAEPTAYHDWIATRDVTVTVPESGDVYVYDAFMIALAEAGLTATLRDANDYVASITKDGVALAEFGNGSYYSGWKYLVNGTYASLGLSHWKIYDGDVIVWHFVNDYGMEDAAWEAAWPDLPPVLTHIEVTDLPTKLSYTVGETLALQGFLGTAYYSSGSTAQFARNTSSATFSPAHGSVLNTPGTVTVTVSFYGKTTSFNVEVAPTAAWARTALGAAIAAAEALDAADYTAGSWSVLAGALADAQAVYADASADVASLLAAIDALEAAVAALIHIDNPSVPLPALAEVQTAVTSVAAYQAAVLAVTDPDRVGFRQEWWIFDLARSGQLDGDARLLYLANVGRYLAGELEDDWGYPDVPYDMPTIDRNKSTENSRLIFTLTALGVDATDFYGWDMTAPLADFGFVGRQGINGSIWALIALDSGGYPMPQLPAGSSATQASRALLVAEILDFELPGGGWNLSGIGEADPDVTGMALLALRPYWGQGDAAIDAAVERAFAKLAALQLPSGGYASWGDENSESLVWVLVALNAYGVPINDPRFVKAGQTPYDVLLDYRLADGSFEHLLGAGSNGMATEQAAYALISLERALSGKPMLFDLTDIALVAWPLVVVDKGALYTTIAVAEALSEGDWTATSWADLAFALAAAEAVADNEYASQGTVDSAAASLNAAITALVSAVPEVDKTALYAAIAVADAKLEADYTPSSWSDFADALAAAKSVAVNASADQDAVDSAASALLFATTALVPEMGVTPVDKDALATAVAAADLLSESDYTTESWAPFATALAAAKTVLADASADQDAVDSAASDLSFAQTSLATKPVVSKDALAAAIAAAEAAVAGKTAGDYTAASWAAFQAALNTAKSVNSAASSSQADVDAAAAALLAATAALEPAPAIVNPPTEYVVLAGFGDFTGTGSRFVVIDADQATFVSLTLGGATVNPANYTVSGGSTVVTLSESYLRTLPAGSYTFRANFTDGYADLVLRVDAPGGGPGSGPGGGTGPGGGPGSGPGGGSSPGALPKTGEDYSLHLLALAFMVAGSVMLLCDWDIRRRRAAEIYFAQHLK